MSEQKLEERRISLEEQKHAHEVELSRERLEVEKRQSGRFSGGAVTLIGSLIAVISAVVTTTIGGIFGLWTTSQNNAAKFALQQEEVRGQLRIKELEVDGQIGVQKLVANAERERLEIQQKFEIIVQATKGLPRDVASDNLTFFVDAGILEDPAGKIRELAAKGEAPDLPAEQSSPVASNPLLERLAAIEQAEQTSTTERSPPRFIVQNGIVLGRGSARVSHVETPNHSGEINPKYIVLHYTGAVGDAAIRTMTNTRVKASAHIIVRRDGSVVQLLPLDYRAWHAGRSQWGSLKGLNHHSVAIELENWGQLRKSKSGWATIFGAPVPSEQVVEAKHEYLTDSTGWQVYSKVQLETLTELLQAIVANDADLVDVIGHETIAAGRKLDPGPALPMSEIRRAVFGRREALPPPT